jgi:hypothetical protein
MTSRALRTGKTAAPVLGYTYIVHLVLLKHFPADNFVSRYQWKRHDDVTNVRQRMPVLE